RPKARAGRVGGGGTLPGVGGPALLDRRRISGVVWGRMKGLLRSGRMPEEALGGLSGSGADDFLAKPFKSGEFLSRVRALLLRRAPQTMHDPGAATLRLPTAGLVRQPPPSTPPVRPTAGGEALSLAASRLVGGANPAPRG